MNRRVKTFINTFSIYAIGTIGIKLITFLLIPLYTYYLTRSEMGFFDIAITSILLLVPITTLDLRDGAFRFLIDNSAQLEKKEVINFIISILIRSSIFIAIIGIILYFFITIPYYPVLILTLSVYSVYEVMIQVVRGVGATKLFVTLGIINTLIIGIFSIIFLVFFEWGILSVFYANIISRILSLIIIESRLKLFSEFLKDKGAYTKKSAQTLLKYTIPLLPNVIAWWLIDGASKFFIENYWGLEYNGIYSVAVRFSNMLQIIVTIFYQTWQETAIKEKNSHDRDVFFSKVFNLYFLILSIGSVILSIGLKVIYPYIIDIKFQESIIYIFPLFISVIFYALSAFLDMAYQCSKQTKRGLPSILSTALLSILLNIILIKSWGLSGAIFSTISSYLFLLVYRIFDTRFYFNIKINKYTIYAIIILSIGSFCFFSQIPNILLISILISFILLFGIFIKKVVIQST